MVGDVPEVCFTVENLVLGIGLRERAHRTLRHGPAVLPRACEVVDTVSAGKGQACIGDEETAPLDAVVEEPAIGDEVRPSGRDLDALVAGDGESTPQGNVKVASPELTAELRGQKPWRGVGGDQR